jgi:hypothetical protein
MTIVITHTIHGVSLFEKKRKIREKRAKMLEKGPIGGCVCFMTTVVEFHVTYLITLNTINRTRIPPAISVVIFGNLVG